MNDLTAAEIGLPTYEAEVRCGLYCQGGSVAFCPTYLPKYADVSDVWVKGSDAAAALSAQRAESERLQARCAELETALLHESTVKGRVAELEKDAARLKQELSECHQNR